MVVLARWCFAVSALLSLAGSSAARADVDVDESLYAPPPVAPVELPADVVAETSASTGDYIAAPAPVLHAPMWLPFGLLDRMRLAPFHMSATTELGTLDGGGTASLTLHAQMSTECSCNIGIYGTLPTSIQLDQGRRFQAAGISPDQHEPPRTQLGTLDVGLFGGARSGRNTWIYRVGTVLPTAAREPHPWLPSARVGDRVLELPRSAGVRLSTSKLFGWRHMRVCDGVDAGFRVDAGIDVASVLAEPGHPVHVIPRAGGGALLSHGGAYTLAIDTAASLDPFVDDQASLRWSMGVTLRRARPDGRGSVIQPAVTLATMHTPEGWGASLLVDLTATAPMHGDSYD